MHESGNLFIKDFELTLIFKKKTGLRQIGNLKTFSIYYSRSNLIVVLLNSSELEMMS